VQQTLAAWMPIVISVATALVVGGLGGWLTRIGPWYRTLIKPSWQPPDWLFGPAWTLIFAFATTAAVLSWNSATGPGDMARVLTLFGINIVLNVAWSALFFRLERPDWAFGEVVLLWLSILAMVVGLWPLNATASLLLLPYLAWVSFAAFLNLTIVRLNPIKREGSLAPVRSQDRT
jgi:tryptophan-rich sensory protein